jgi:hypothetical protein
MYSIKIMSRENMPDADVGKGFKMILVDAGDTFEFGHNDQGEPIVTVSVNKGEESSCIEYPVTGNAYVMSETGKTVASFWARNKQTVRVTIDPRDPEPERTVSAIQAVVREYSADGKSASLGPVGRDSYQVAVDRFTVADEAITDTTDVTTYNAEQRCMIYRTRVGVRMRNGATQAEAMAAEARWIQ